MIITTLHVHPSFPTKKVCTFIQHFTLSRKEVMDKPHLSPSITPKEKGWLGENEGKKEKEGGRDFGRVGGGWEQNVQQGLGVK